MDQLSFSLSSEPMRSDEIIAAIRPSIDALLPLFNLSARHVSSGPLRENVGKSNEKKIGTSLSFSIAPSSLASLDSNANKSRGAVILRVKDQVLRSYLEFPADRKSFYASIGEITAVGAAESFLRINLDAVPDTDAIASAVCADIGARLRVFPSDFACCGLYKQCSDAGRCISDNQDMAAGCYYKRNLMAGKVFFGQHARKEV